MSKIEITTTKKFKLAYNDAGSGANMDGAFYNPIDLPIGFYSIGSYGQSNYGQPDGELILVKELEPKALAKPLDFKLVYNDQGSGAHLDGSFWLPIPPDGYCAMGILCVRGYEKPSIHNTVVCLKKELTVPAKVGRLIWEDKGSGAKMDGSFWEIDNPAGSIETGTFAGASNFDPPTKSPVLHAIAASAV